MIVRYFWNIEELRLRHHDRPWFNNEIRKEIRIRDRFRKTVLKFHREKDIKLYKKQRNKVNNMKKIAKENFENNLDHIKIAVTCAFFQLEGYLH
jgi:hypothetical protein